MQSLRIKFDFENNTLVFLKLKKCLAFIYLFFIKTPQKTFAFHNFLWNQKFLKSFYFELLKS